MPKTSEPVIIQRLGQEDVALARMLFLVLQSVFEEEQPASISVNYAEKLLQDSRFIVYTAMQNNEILGGLTAYELPLYRVASSEIFLYDIAVKPEHQRKGVGRLLLQTLRSYCQQNGFRCVFVPANEEDTTALDFYRATGGEAEKVVHFTYWSNQQP